MKLKHPTTAKFHTHYQEVLKVKKLQYFLFKKCIYSSKRIYILKTFLKQQKNGKICCYFNTDWLSVCSYYDNQRFSSKRKS